MKQLNERPIAFYPYYAKLTGSILSGVLLSQLMYWFTKKDKFYKTDKELRDETLLSENELRTAKGKIKKIPFIKITKEGIPCKTYYAIEWEIYESSFVSSTELVSWNPRNKDSDIHKTITKTTTKTTAKTNTLVSSIEHNVGVNQHAALKTKDSFIDNVFNQWNRFAEEHKCSKLISMNNTRKAKLRKRQKEATFHLDTILTMAGKSKFLTGKGSNWKMTFDWLIANETNYIKILEGNYDQNNVKTSQPVSIGKHEMF